jgi:hypothetical protein
METRVFKTYAHVNGAPIKILDTKTDQWKEYGAHDDFGWDYYILITTTYSSRTLIVPQGINVVRERPNPDPILPSLLYHEFIPTGPPKVVEFMHTFLDETITFQRNCPDNCQKALHFIRHGDSWHAESNDGPFANVPRIGWTK